MPNLNWSLTPDEARALYSLVASVVVPFVVSFVKRADWKPEAKVALAVLVSLIGAVLSEYVAGTLSSIGSVVMVTIAIFTATQAHYNSWFKSLGAEQWLAEDRLIRDRLRLL